ncbi:MAG: hypothetical protein BMS9Abin29_0385 [Gemmatimonadota bacterium]|nr:MAG: hypothetical protein BMS9Abin29_0385 [Gemmatimonadota bacterium]
MQLNTRTVASLAAGFLLGAAPTLYAQSAESGTGTLAGMVYDSTTGGPLIHATVHVLGTEFFGQSNLFGKFAITGLPVGDYGVTFSHSRADQLEYLPPAYIINIREGETSKLDLFVPSLPSILTASCAWFKDGRGALTGYVRERYRRTPLPQSRVRISWPARGDVPGGEALAITDIDGVYRLCQIPANIPVTAEADFLGLTVRTSGLIVGPNESRRRDFDIDAIGVDKKKVKLDRQARERLIDGETDVQGRLRDADSSQPVEAAFLQIRNHDEVALTDRDGRFVFHDVRAGIRVLDVQHLAYGDQTTEILLTRGGATDIEVQVKQQAVELDPIVVTARKQVRLDRRTVSLGTRKDVLVREQIAKLARTSLDAGDLLRRFPGVRVRSIDVGGARLLCVNRGRGGRDRSSLTSGLEAARGSPGCDTLPVFVDGQPMMDPERLLALISPEDIESIELVTSTGAAAFPGAQNGAIVIYTRGNGPWAQRRR